MRRALSTRFTPSVSRFSNVGAPTSVPLYLHPTLARPGDSLRQRLPGTRNSRFFYHGRGLYAEDSGAAGLSNSDKAVGVEIDRDLAARRTEIAGESTRESALESSWKSVEEIEGDARDEPDRPLPLTCPGCGAFSQTLDPEQIGYYDTSAKRIQKWVRPAETMKPRKFVPPKDDKIVDLALAGLTEEQQRQLKLDHVKMEQMPAPSEAPVEIEHPPICNRCHDILHYNLQGPSVQTSIFHPTVESLRETIDESPHKYNHIYHVIDAIDFPMSLIPRLNTLLGAGDLRSRNRRFRGAKYQADRQTLMSFIITRGDLLGPDKEKVDRLMPYLREVLRSALGRVGPHVRLGNVRCVSAMRGWWTGFIRDEIRDRGGATWMVGKVNTGKSKLFESIYPKGRVGQSDDSQPASALAGGGKRDELDDFGQLLPPPQELRMYPQMPLVSAISGATTSPIRVPFGKNGGELIDMPGLARDGLEMYVKPESRLSTVMQRRVDPEQISIGEDESLILGGGLIRLTPRTKGLTFLLYNFTPLKEHVCSTWKAEAYQDQTRTFKDLNNITMPEYSTKMKLAGSIRLRWCITKARAGPLTRRQDVGLAVQTLPFRVMSADILIEGIGYVEVVAQIRAKGLPVDPSARPPNQIPDPYDPNPVDNTSTPPPKSPPADPFERMMDLRRDSHSSSIHSSKSLQPEEDPAPEDCFDDAWPLIDVFTPEGKGIACREPLNGRSPKITAAHRARKHTRPRRSIKSRRSKGKR